MKPRINCSEQFFQIEEKMQKFSNIDVLSTSQRKKLPSGNFKFVPDPEKIGRELIEKYNPEDKVGYIMKVDLVSTKNHLVRQEFGNYSTCLKEKNILMTK